MAPSYSQSLRHARTCCAASTCLSVGSRSWTAGTSPAVTRSRDEDTRARQFDTAAVSAVSHERERAGCLRADAAAHGPRQHHREPSLSRRRRLPRRGGGARRAVHQPVRRRPTRQHHPLRRHVRAVRRGPGGLAPGGPAGRRDARVPQAHRRRARALPPRPGDHLRRPRRRRRGAGRRADQRHRIEVAVGGPPGPRRHLLRRLRTAAPRPGAARVRAARRRAPSPAGWAAWSGRCSQDPSAGAATAWAWRWAFSPAACSMAPWPRPRPPPGRWPAGSACSRSPPARCRRWSR